jgi:hypothetical protein
MRWPIIVVLLLVASLNAPAQQKPTTVQTSTAVCTFADGNQVTVRFPALPTPKEDLRKGEAWPPKSSPVYLFTSSGVAVGDSTIQPGAFSIYLIPGKETWTLVINKSVAPDTPYDHSQDLARHPMQIGQLSNSESFDIAFAQVAPKQCNMRIYYGKVGAWAEFKEK